MTPNVTHTYVTYVTYVPNVTEHSGVFASSVGLAFRTHTHLDSIVRGWALHVPLLSYASAVPLRHGGAAYPGGTGGQDRGAGDGGGFGGGRAGRHPRAAAQVLGNWLSGSLKLQEQPEVTLKFP